MSAPAGPSPPVRDAATVMLVRDASGGGVEVFMLRRNLASVFVGGAYVFPGGAVDAADRGLPPGGWLAGRSDEQASAILGLPRGGLAFWVAAIRECFEEAGVLLASHADGSVVSFSDPDVAGRFQSYRDELNRGEGSLAGLCRRESLALDLGRMHYFGHWITPEGAPRRYDTRFFVVAAPPQQVPLHDDRETIANLWVRPSDALARFASGDFELIYPTIKNLEAIGRFPSSAALLSAAARVAERPADLPRLAPGGEGVVIPLPGAGI